MREAALHYIWQNRLYERLLLDGQPVEVVQVGHHNDSDGPDFALVKIQTPELLWVGSVELHMKSSDWIAHGHHEDPRYGGVLLHVVLDQDRAVSDWKGREVPTAVLQVSPAVLQRIEQLEVSTEALRCTPELALISSDQWETATAPLLQQRMEQKIRRLSREAGVEGTLTFFYHALMRYMGAHQNNDVMELVARSLPYSFLKKHASAPIAIEAMLIGQAGLLAEVPRDAYEKKLGEEYLFYRTKFGLTPIEGNLFRKLHIRPASYPCRRLSIISRLIQREQELLQWIAEERWEDIMELLSIEPSEYWRSHIDFGQESKRAMRGLGAETVRSIMINVIIPTAYSYAQTQGKTSEATNALAYLHKLPREQNKIVQRYEENGIKIRSAADSQCALALYTDYCSRHRCLSCPIAPQIFQSLYHHSHE